MMLHERERSQMLQEMGDEGVTFDVTWTWQDGRRSFGFGPYKTHRRTATWDAKQLAEDFYQAWVLTDTPPMLRLGEAADEAKKALRELPKIRTELERMRRLAERAVAPDDDGPA